MTGLSRRRTRLTTPLRRLRAARAGVFWLPCPLCGDLFSGLECATMLTVAVADNPTVQQIACRVCEDEWSITAGEQCAAQGHDPVGIWFGRERGRSRAHGRVTFRYRFDLAGEPDQWRCSRCYARLPAGA